ncbi:MAG: hypothetical protein ACI4S2_16130 [Lachnospiraceae bacterium]
MMKMNKKVISLAACALVLIVGLSVKPAMAYFTASVSANGKVAIAIDDTHAKITESGSGETKVISVANTESTPCYVRVAVIMPESIKATYVGAGWSLNDDGYYYYENILQPDESATELTLSIDTTNALADAKLTYADFNVIVIPESAKVLYDENGNAYAGWDQEIYEEGGNN